MNNFRCAAVAVACFLATACSTSQYDLAITNVSIVDAVNGERSNQTVVLDDGKIHSIAAAGNTATAEEVIDGDGLYLMPGLWDMHVHIVYEDGLIDAMPDLFLDYGITSVRDTGALLDRITPQVERWRSLGAAAPDLYYSGPLLDGQLVVYDGDDRPAIGVSNPSVAAALERLTALQASGVSFIKIYELVSPEVFDALAAAARDAGLPIAAHVPLSMRAETAGPKVNSMEHLRNIELACTEDADALYASRQSVLADPGERSGYALRRDLHAVQRALAMRGADPDSARCQNVLRALSRTTQVPTLRLNTITTHSPTLRSDWIMNLERLPPDVAEQWLQTATYFAGQKSDLGDRLSSWSLALTSAMLKAGVPIGAGTDTPIGQAIPGYSLHTELERLVEAGLTPQQALFAATVVPPRFFGLEDRMGQIQPGMEADLVLLEANPLKDITNTRRIRAVISDGVKVR